MRYKIHFTHSNGDDDNVIIQADTIEAVREKAFQFIESRNAEYSFSENLEPEEE